jgi:hypothetical protein
MQPPIEPPKPASRFREFAPPAVIATVAEHPSTPYSREWWCRRFGAQFPDDFVEMINPGTTKVRALVFLGPPAKTLPEPRDGGDDLGDVDAVPSNARKAWALAVNRAKWTLIEIAGGGREYLPKSIIGALVRTTPDGSTVIGGLCPSLQIYLDEANPVMHSSLAEAASATIDPFAMPTAAARGVKK